MILSGNQPAMERKEKSEKRQLRGSHPGCLAEAAITTEPDNYNNYSCAYLDMVIYIVSIVFMVCTVRDTRRL